MAPSPGKFERFEWTPERVALLGTAPDGEISAQVGLAPFDSLRSLRASGGRVVQVERKRRGIAPFVAQVPRVIWTEEALGMLGKVPDRVVAEKLGTTTTTVSIKRSQLGIMSSRGVGSRKYRWSAAAVEMLGKESDAAVAGHLGLCQVTVRTKRKQQGIPPFKPHGAVVKWTPEMDADFASLTDEQMAEKWRIGIRSANDRRHVVQGVPTGLFRMKWTPAHIRLLGTKTDGELAKEWGCSLEGVRFKRVKLGIPLVEEPRRIDWSQVEDLMGHKSDTEIALMLGCDRASVTMRRNALGIPPPPRIRRRWTGEELNLLGRFTDSEVARRIGTDRLTVRKKRIELGRPLAPFEQGLDWTPEMDRLMGTDSDVKVGKLIGRTGPAVCMRRKELGIPSMSERLKLREWRERAR